MKASDPLVSHRVAGSIIFWSRVVAVASLVIVLGVTHCMVADPVLVAAAGGDDSAGLEQTPPGMRLVADNEYLSLYINDDTTEIAVRDKRTGSIWYSNPPDRDQNEKIARGTAKARLGSQVSIVFYTPGDLEQRKDSFNDSVSIGQYQVSEIPYGVRVHYRFGQEYPDLALLPPLISKQSVERISASITDEKLRKDFEGIFRDYTLISLVPLEEGEDPMTMASIDTKKVFGNYKLVGVDTRLSSTKTRDTLRNLINRVVAGHIDIERWDQLTFEHFDPFRNNEVYLLNEKVPQFILADIETTLTEVGYTMADKVRDCIELGLDPPVRNLEVFEVAIEYTLDADTLVVRIPIEDVRYPLEVEDVVGKYGPRGGTVTLPLHSIEVLSYFGAAGQAEEGYILVPDGSGALIYLNNGKISDRPYVGNVYGQDNSAAIATEKLEHTERVHLPVYGIKTSENAFLAVIEEGASLARIRADVAGRNNSYNTVSPEFIVMQRGRTRLSIDSPTISKSPYGFRNEINVYQSRLCSTDLVIRYSFLHGGDASYVGMARRYQDYLIRSGVLSKGDLREDVPLFLELVGAIDVNKSVLGIPREVIEPLTTYSQVEMIVRDVIDRNVDNLKLRYTGWMAGGVRHHYPSGVTLEKALGSNQDFSDLTGFLSETGVEFYPDVSFMNVQRNTLLDGFVATRDGARLLNRRVAKVYDYDLATLQAKRNTERYVLSPSRLGALVDEFISEYKDYGVGGISVRYMGTQVNSDFRTGRDLVDRSEAADVIHEQARKLSVDAGLKVMAEGANDLVLPYVDCIVNMPTESSQYFIIDESVPFSQIAVHGFIEYAGEPLNLSPDPVRAVLKAAETGGGLYCKLFYSGGEAVKETDYDYLYSAEYSRWIDRVLALYQDLNSALGSLNGVRIIGHEQVATGVYRTTYENGMAVLVNYNDNEADVCGVTVLPRSFTLLDEGEKHE